MTLPDRAATASRDAHLIRTRLWVLGGLGVLLLAVLLLRVAWMQVVQAEHYEVLAANNLLRPVPVAPRRGLIQDRHGALLATNHARYSLNLTTAQIDDVAGTVAHLRTLATIHDWEVARFRKQMRGRRHQPVLLRSDLGEEELARIAAQIHQLPGVSLNTYLVRHYPEGPATAHVLGYLGDIDEADRAKIDRARYRATQRIGKVGIERQYEELLLGYPGMRQASVDSYGRVLQLQDLRVPRRGATVTLTLDAELQRAAAAALDGRAGSVVALDPYTGDVLALVNTPQFQPDLFASRLSPEDVATLYENPGRPLLNRAVQGHYPPGSTIKPFIALAALEEGAVLPQDRYFARPEFWLPGHSRPFRDWKEEGHGWVTVRSAIAQSSDVYFYALAHRLGIDAIHKHLGRFGLGAAQGVDIPGETAGILPSRQWKRESLGEAWYPGETVISGIGQGYMLVTPLQLATATAVLATRGTRMRPRLLLSWNDEAQRLYTAPEIVSRVELADPGHWQLIVDAMVDVVHAPNGTARASGRGAAYRIAGKTGTAQVVALDKDRDYGDHTPMHLRDHSLFIAFAPVDAPRIALAVVVEHGGSGSKTAAPIARRLLDVYLRERTPPGAAS